jgi:hypothetical protein
MPGALQAFPELGAPALQGAGEDLLGFPGDRGRMKGWQPMIRRFFLWLLNPEPLTVSEKQKQLVLFSEML